MLLELDAETESEGSDPDFKPEDIDTDSEYEKRTSSLCSGDKEVCISLASKDKEGDTHLSSEDEEVYIGIDPKYQEGDSNSPSEDQGGDGDSDSPSEDEDTNIDPALDSLPLPTGPVIFSNIIWPCILSLMVGFVP
ncbi:hypothetical protein TWF281_005282 [Arthrobotrys megalospora]